MSYKVIVNGKPPPYVFPHCASCGVPVERYTVFDPIDDGAGGAMFAAEAECHGQTMGIYIKQDDMKALALAGKTIVLFQRRQGFDRV